MDIILNFQVISSLFLKDMKQNGFNAGLRLSLVMDRLGLTQNEFAEMINGGQSTVSNWLKMEKFSKVIVGRLWVLEAKGINVNYFMVETAPMLLKDVKETNPEDSIRVLQNENTALKRKLDRLERDLKECKEGAK